jgi:uncharacterized protein with HEPN domain
VNDGLRDRDYLRHIEAAICKIQRFLEDQDECQFMEDELLQDGVIRNLEIIGEAASKLSKDTTSHYTDVPWREIAGMRHRLIHGYMSVDLNIVWDTVVLVLPDFLQKIRAIISEREA